MSVKYSCVCVVGEHSQGCLCLYSLPINVRLRVRSYVFTKSFLFYSLILLPRAGVDLGRRGWAEWVIWSLGFFSARLLEDTYLYASK